MPSGIYQHKPFTEEHKRKISQGLKGKPKSEEHRERLSKRIISKEWKEKISKSCKGKKMSEEAKKKISLGRIGRKPALGKHWKISNEAKEKHRKIAIKMIMMGIHPFWQGGIWRNPYPINWIETLKRSIRERDHYICKICGREPAICVHHIDYNKNNCCSDNLIIVCRSCHAKTNNNRNYWIKFFEIYLENIRNK